MKENLFLPQVGVVQGELPGVAHVEVVAHHGDHVEHDEAHDDHVELLVGDDPKYNCLKVESNYFQEETKCSLRPRNGYT